MIHATPQDLLRRYLRLPLSSVFISRCFDYDSTPTLPTLLLARAAFEFRAFRLTRQTGMLIQAAAAAACSSALRLQRRRRAFASPRRSASIRRHDARR